MTKTILALSTALSILAVTPAFAQDSTSVDCTVAANKSDPACMKLQNNNSNATQDQTGAAKTTDQNAATTTTTTNGATQSMSAAQLIVPADRLNGVQLMSANDFIGKTVYDQSGNNIGDVNDLIMSNDGQIQAVILGVGGFLGIGEKDVAVNTEAIQIVQDGDSKRLVVQATKEALNAAPSYDRMNRRYATDANAPAATDQTGSTTAPAGTVDCALAANASNPACVNKTQQ